MKKQILNKIFVSILIVLLSINLINANTITLYNYSISHGAVYVNKITKIYINTTDINKNPVDIDNINFSFISNNLSVNISPVRLSAGQYILNIVFTETGNKTLNFTMFQSEKIINDSIVVDIKNRFFSLEYFESLGKSLFTKDWIMTGTVWFDENIFNIPMNILIFLIGIVLLLMIIFLIYAIKYVVKK